MQMHHVEARYRGPQLPSHCGRPIKPSQKTGGEVPDFNFVQFNRYAQWNVAIALTIDIGGKHMYIMAASSQGFTETVYRIDGAAITGCRKICGYYM